MPKRTLVLLISLLALGGCNTDPPPGSQYYDRVIQPILTTSCATTTSGCHRADPADQFAFASGNLDLTSFENVQKRPDVLQTFGAYPLSLLLMKSVAKEIGGASDLQVAYRDEFLTLEIPHSGGAAIQITSEAFLTLQTWLENGATQSGRPLPEAPVVGEGGCSSVVPDDFDETTVTSTTQWSDNRAMFADVQSVLDSNGCSAGNCHGAPQSDFYITCGNDPRQEAFNFRQVWAFVDDPVDDSEVLRRPLAPGTGGLSHSGGVHFSTRSDGGYAVISAFAGAVGPLPFAQGDPGKEFFANEVMPVLLVRGCAVQGCHSPAATNDYKLRAGSQGFFSAVALEKNYDLTKREFMSFEMPDVRRSRVVAKNLILDGGGIAHRGGPLLETPGAGRADPANCPPVFDPNANNAAFCVFVEWSRIERAGVGNPNGGAQIPLVYVERPATHTAGPLEFDSYQPNSDLLVVDAAIGANGAITGTSGRRSLLGTCPGASNRAVVDVHAPDVKNDGVTVVFAMRTAAGEGLQLYTVDISGAGCQRITTPNGLDHNFDPAWTPDGEWIVFASSRAGGMSKRLGLPQSDIWRMLPNGTGLEQVTFLSNSELSPQFMREGRIIMTTEKVDPFDNAAGFYQLSGRRINWDLTDYHPLLAQRAMSPVNPADPAGDQRESVGYGQATEIREAWNGNFIFVLSDPGARAGAGTLAIFNRSVGPVEATRTDPGYLRSMTIPDLAATGRGMSSGAYRSPFMLPNGEIMTAYVGGAIDINNAGSFDFDLVAVNVRTGQRTTILGGAGQQVDAVLALRYEPRELYLNRRQLVFGGNQDTSDLSRAVVHFPDAAVVGSLLGSNLRRGRFVDDLRSANTLVIYNANGGVLGTTSLMADGSAKIRVPAGVPVAIGLRAGATDLFRMSEEHQFGPGENISLGITEPLFNAVCGGCHGSISGLEIDVLVTPDVLTGASQSLAADSNPVDIQ